MPMHNPVKKLTSRILDNIVLEKLEGMELTVETKFRQWWRSTLVNVGIVVALVAAGIVNFFISGDNGLMKLFVALAYLFSIAVFLVRRAENIRFFVQQRTIIIKYVRLVTNALKVAERGKKIHTVGWMIYQDMYAEKMGKRKTFAHSTLAFLRLVPDRDDVFDIIYPRMVEFFRSTIYRRLVRFASFVACFSVIGLFVKNAVLLEMRFPNVFSTVLYPFIYSARIAGLEPVAHFLESLL